MYGWGPFVPDSSWRRRRITGAVIVVIGLGLLVWGIGSVYNAVAANGIPTFPRDEQIGLWVNACGILLMSVATIAAGIVQQVL
jgi:divalent metal cation (Fe/Co/Zn/Cd) transporter